MNMSENQSPYPSEVVIDLRELIQTLLNYKWVIIAVTILAALGVFLVSVFIIPPKYQASAVVTLIEPIIEAELETSIRFSPTMPDTGALADFAEADELVDQVIDRLDLEDYFEKNDPDLDASLKGSSQIHLQVTTNDPARSAQISNAWAQVLVNRLNDLYGTGEKDIATLESEVENAREDWNETQAALEAYLPESKVEVLEVQLSQAKDLLSFYLNKIDHNQLLISDALALQKQLSIFRPNEPLATGNALAVIALQQRASGGISGTQFQVQGSEILGEGYSVLMGRESIQELMNAIQEQNADLENKVPKLESRIETLSVELEEERFKVDQLKQERDLARNAFTALSNQLTETRITQAQDQSSAKIGAPAVEPREESAPNIPLNTLVAAFLGMLISVSGSFLYDWWQKGN